MLSVARTVSARLTLSPYLLTSIVAVSPSWQIGSPSWQTNHATRGVARPEQDVWEGFEDQSPVFRDEVDGVRGALAFFTVVAPSPISASTAASQASQKQPREE